MNSSGNQITEVVRSFIAPLMLAMPQYGKGEKEVSALVGLHAATLDGYEPSAVAHAYRQHIRLSNKMPMPADIIAIIDPQPIFDRELFTNLEKKMRKNEFSVTGQEKEYIKWCKNKIMAGK